MAEEPVQGEESPRGVTPPERFGRGFFTNGAAALTVFALGVAAGFPIATLGIGFFIDNAVPVLGGLLAALVAVLIAVGILIAFRKRIWRALFRRGEIAVEQLAGPLANVVRYVAENRVGEATASAREFAELAIARYSWLMTRRWMVATVTSLVVAIAALAGAALLFEQNQLLRAQSALLSEQNDRITDQTALMQAQIQLGEAQRSTSIVPEILAIGAAIGEETARLVAAGHGPDGFGADELSAALRARIIAATNSARPYRHLLSPLAELNEIEIIAAAFRRRTDLPITLADYEQWQLTQQLMRPLAELGMPTNELTDREVSPERGQLITLLYNNRIQDTAHLSFAGADFSFAELRQPLLEAMSFRHARLRFVDFSGVEIRDVSFGGAALDHARFRNSTIVRADFGGIANDAIQAPFSPNPALPIWMSALNGAEFTGAFIVGSSFVSAQAFGADFDDAFLLDTEFGGAALGAATFRNAMIFECDFTGANMSGVDLSGAIVFGADFLTALQAMADGQSFVASRFALEAVTADTVSQHRRFNDIDPAIYEGIDNGTLQAFRVVQVGPFESNPGRATTVFQR